MKDVQYFVQLTNKSNNLGRHSLEDLNCIDRNSPSICYVLPHFIKSAALYSISSNFSSELCCILDMTAHYHIVLKLCARKDRCHVKNVQIKFSLVAVLTNNAPFHKSSKRTITRNHQPMYGDADKNIKPGVGFLNFTWDK